MTAPSTLPVTFSFESKAMDPDTFEVTAFSGQEEISRSYRFEIDLVADDPDIDMDKLLFQPATLVIEKGDEVRKIHGILAECGLCGALPDNRYCYQVVLRPRIWLLEMNRQNQIYQDLSVTDIVEEEIKGSTAKGSTKPAAAGLSGDDYELRLTRAYSQREYIVQYDESDLNFISRLMEHEGLFYFFEQDDEKEKLIISDNNIHFAALENNDTIAYRPASGLARTDDEAILSLSAVTRRVPRKLVLKDYNYRTPHLPLQAEADVDDKSHGLVSQYGDHFKTSEEGGIMASIRSQELYCAKQVFDGTSDSIRLQPGWRYKLDEHFREAFNAEYVVTRIAHKGRQPLEGAAGLHDDGLDAADYGNSFTCIPAEVAYRPPRRTPKPMVPGLMNAHVDAALLENRAEIDEQGRYKLIMPFDLSGAAAGKASRYVRKAQPYGGQDRGMHFPLHKGTEVICTFINGDPDRPIITGVVPNPLTASVVNSDNYTKNIVKTGHGSYFEFNDGKGPADKDAVPSNGNLAAQQQQQPMALTSACMNASGLSETMVGETPQETPGQGNLAMQQQQQLSSAEEENPGSGDDVWFRIGLPNYDIATSSTAPKASYLRLGVRPTSETLWSGQAPDGWFDYTDGDRTTVTRGNKEEKVMTEEGWCAYEGIHKFLDTPVARKVTLEHTSSFSGAFGDEESYFAGSQIEGFVGFKNEIAIASCFESFMGVKYEAHLDWNFQIGTSGTVNLINGDECTVVDDQQTFGTEIKFHVVEKDMTPEIWTVIHILLQLGGAAVVGAAAGAKIALHAIDTKDTHFAGDVAEWSTHGLAVVTHVAMLIYSLIAHGKAKKREKLANANTQLNLLKDEIFLTCGDAGLQIKDGIVNIFGDQVVLAPSNQNTVTIDSKGASVDIGDVNVKNGKVISKSDIETKTGRFKSPTWSSDPVASPSLPRVGKKNMAIIRKLKKKRLKFV